MPIADAFLRSFERAAGQSTQYLQDKRRLELARRAQKVKEQVAQERIRNMRTQRDQMRQDIQQDKELFPLVLDREEANIAATEAGTRLTREEADQAALRTDALPDQLDTEQAIREANALIQETTADATPDMLDARQTMLRQQGRQAGAAADRMNFQVEQARKEQERLQGAQQSMQEIQGTLSQPTPSFPQAQQDPIDLLDIPRAIHNYTTGPALALATQMFGGPAYSNILQGITSPVRGGQRLTEDQQRAGQRAATQELATIRSARMAFENAPTEARPPQLAQQALQRIQMLEQQLAQNTYGLSKDQLEQMKRDLETDKQFFRQYQPQPNPMVQDATELFQRSMEEESFGPARDALKLIQQMNSEGQ